MKKIVIVFIFFNFFLMNGQSKKEIAGVYFDKAVKSMETLNYELAKVHFEKGIGYLGTITSAETALNGTFIYYELKKFEKAKEYAKQFFVVSKNKKSENYIQMLSLYVEIEEEIFKKTATEKRILAEKIKKQEQLRKIDSLKKVWAVIEKGFILPVDTLHAFNEKGYALYKKAGFYGVIDDKGAVVIAASTYKAALQNEGYFILMNTKVSPKKILSFNSEKRKAVQLPNPSSFNNNLTNYGTVTLPRGNGRIAMYPNEIRETIIYDLEQEKFVKILNLKDLFKGLKKGNKIDKFDIKEESVKINKVWYRFGGDLGGDVYSLFFTDTNDRYGFLLGNTNSEKRVLKVSDFDFLGVYYDNKLSAIKEKNSVWITNEGNEGNKPIKLNFYSNEVKIKTLPNQGGYQLVKEGVVFLNDKKLEKLRDFLIRNK